MDVFGDLLARDRRSEHPALEMADGRVRSYHELLTNAYKAGNALRHMGVREGVEVGIAPVPTLQPILGFLGASLQGAVTRFDPDASVEAGAQALLVPAATEAEYDPGPATKLAVFGGEPARAETRDWEETMWSENPSFPPTAFGPETPVLAADGAVWSHGDVLTAAAEVAEVNGLTGDTKVVLRTSLATPGAVVAGLIAPLVTGATAVVVGESGGGAEAGHGTGRGTEMGTETQANTEPEPETDLGLLGDVAVGDGPEPVRIDPGTVPL